MPLPEVELFELVKETESKSRGTARISEEEYPWNPRRPVHRYGEERAF